ncbi:MAG: aspartate aminotransferase family protein [Chitinophagaceae bacterium]
MTNRQLFLQHIAQTSDSPLALEIVKAEGMYLWDAQGRKFLDLIAGISVCNLGHRHPAILEAIQQQLGKYMHLMVYGEFVESPQVEYAHFLTNHLPASLNSVYFVNSGTEATEGAMKLAKRVTGRTEIISFNKSYHGSTQGALSVIGDEYWRNAFRPLLPDIRHLVYNDPEGLELITTRTACVIAETVQAEAGVQVPDPIWIRSLSQKCREVGALLILDEIQSGFGRHGTLWAFEQFGVIPDLLLLGKALGGGLPLGAFIANRDLTGALSHDPVLGHITTFGGHPVCCAAGLAGMKVLLKEGWIQEVKKKEQWFLQLLVHAQIRKVRSHGLMLAVEFDSFATNKKVIDRCLQNGVLTDWFLFAPQCLRIVPPLTISMEQIAEACRIILKSIDEIQP